MRVCSVDGCERRHCALGLCSMHWARQNRGSPVGGPERLHLPDGSGHRRRDGYLELTLRGHPLADPRGRLLAHRAVLFGMIGPGTHRCHWCGVAVSWDLTWPVDAYGLVADHVDGDNTNDSQENLVPSCGTCNRDRGKVFRERATV